MGDGGASSDPFGLAGVGVLVTGASSGFGAHFATILAKQGAKVAVAARRADRLAQLVETIRDAGGQAAAVALGPIDVVINNAGVNARGLATDISAEDFDQVMAVNVRGVFLCAREGARRMIARGSRETGRGRVINIASIGAHTVLPGLTAYCTSKAAVAMMTKSLAREWARQGVSVNALCPGYVETEINAGWLQEEGGQRMVQGFPRRRLMQASAMDNTVLFLAGAHSAATTGAVITIDDGQSL